MIRGTIDRVEYLVRLREGSNTVCVWVVFNVLTGKATVYDNTREKTQARSFDSANATDAIKYATEFYEASKTYKSKRRE
mgnify:CR=1 FL=1